MLNEDLLAKAEREVDAWKKDHEWFFDPMRYFLFAVKSGLAPYAVEEPFFSNTLVKADANKDNKLILLSRGHYKSSEMKALICFMLADFTAHRWGAQVRIPVIGEAEKFGKRTVKAARRALTSNPYILRTYGMAKPSREQMKRRIEALLADGKDVEEVPMAEWTVGEFRTSWCIESEFRTGTVHEEPSCWSQGMNEARTGFHWDCGMMDDPVGESSAKSIVKKQKQEGVYYELQSQRNPGSLLMIHGTRHAHDDIHNTILTKHVGQYEIIVGSIWGNGPRLSLKEDFKQDRETGRWSLARRKPSEVEILYEGYGQIEKEIEQGYRTEPVQRKLDALHHIAVKMDSMPESRFVKQYENRVVASDAQLFHAHMFRPYRPGALPPARHYILTDSATGKDSRSSYRVVAVLACVADGTRYIVDLDFGRWGPEEYCQRWLDQEKRHGAHKVLLEKVAWQEAFRSTAKLLCEIQKRKMPTVEMVEGRSLVSKLERIEPLEPLLRQGKMFFNEKLKAKECDGRNVWDEMVEQFTRVHEEEQVKGLLLDIPDAISDTLATTKDGDLICTLPRFTRASPRERIEDAVQQPLYDSRSRKGPGKPGAWDTRAARPKRDIWG